MVLIEQVDLIEEDRDIRAVNINKPGQAELQRIHNRTNLEYII